MGIEQLESALLRMPDEIAIRVGRNAMRAGARILVEAVKSRMPVDTGTARESIDYTRVKHYPTSGTLFLAVEPKKGLKVETPHGTRYPRKYMHLIERGRREVAPKSARAMRAFVGVPRYFMKARAVTGHPVFQPAFAASRTAAEQAVIAEVELGLKNYEAKLKTQKSML